MQRHKVLFMWNNHCTFCCLFLCLLACFAVIYLHCLFVPEFYSFQLRCLALFGFGCVLFPLLGLSPLLHLMPSMLLLHVMLHACTLSGAWWFLQCTVGHMCRRGYRKRCAFHKIICNCNCKCTDALLCGIEI